MTLDVEPEPEVEPAPDVSPPASFDRRSRRQRRNLLTAVATIAVGLSVVLAGRSPAGAQGDLEAKGRQLYLVGCVSCHGTSGRGVGGSGDDARGPSLVRAGEASAYYQLSSGRMPLNNPKEEPSRKDPAYNRGEIDALVAYVASLGKGPKLPRLRLDDADLAMGGSTFRTNCQACHSASGAGGALSYGRAAPALDQAEPEQIAAAMRSGPGQMPVFGRNEIDDRQLADVVAYVRYLDNPDDRGGLPLGRVGPVPEGFVAWSVGVVALLAFVFWIGTRSPIRRRTTTVAASSAGPVPFAGPDPQDHS